MVVGRQGHKDIGVRCANGSGIAVGQAYVVDDALNFAWRNLLSNRPLHQITQIGGFLNAHSGGSTQVKFEGSAVYAGKKIPTQPGNQNCQRPKRRCEKRHQENPAVVETAVQQSAISVTKAFECPLKPLLQPDQGITARSGGSFVSYRIVPQKILGHRRDDGSREKVRCEDRKSV